VAVKHLVHTRGSSILVGNADNRAGPAVDHQRKLSSCGPQVHAAGSWIPSLSCILSSAWQHGWRLWLEQAIHTRMPCKCYSFPWGTSGRHSGSTVTHRPLIRASRGSDPPVSQRVLLWAFWLSVGRCGILSALVDFFIQGGESFAMIFSAVHWEGRGA
jgi:hypothetical protein